MFLRRYFTNILVDMPAILSCPLVAPLGNEGGDCDIAADPYRTVGILIILLLFQIYADYRGALASLAC